MLRGVLWPGRSPAGVRCRACNQPIVHWPLGTRPGLVAWCQGPAAFPGYFQLRPRCCLLSTSFVRAGDGVSIPASASPPYVSEPPLVLGTSQVGLSLPGWAQQRGSPRWGRGGLGQSSTVGTALELVPGRLPIALGTSMVPLGWSQHGLCCGSLQRWLGLTGYKSCVWGE